ncbi:hypothetical protein RUND412_002989 [Rhizina undulata]
MEKPALIIATDDENFNTGPWETEGYRIIYIPRATQSRIEDASEDFETDEKYGIVAFGNAASYALNLATSPAYTLTAIAAYYPPSLPKDAFHPSIHIVIHLPESHHFSPVRSPEHAVRVYPGTSPGFAEATSRYYERHSASIAFSRSLALFQHRLESARRIDIEDLWDEHLACEFVDRNVQKTMDTMAAQPYVNHIPTCTGGRGYDDLRKFYKDFFLPCNPPSMKRKLISRTVGSNRIVDEMIITFRHTCEIPWLLPGVGPTGKECEIALVAIVGFRGPKLAMEHIYWDQASVLVQLGLLDNSTLPVVGHESARKVLKPEAVESNALIPEWRKKN